MGIGGNMKCVNCGEQFHQHWLDDEDTCPSCKKEAYLETFVKCTKCGVMYDPETNDSVCDDCENL